MTEIEMLCMANSWKHKERCIAGLLPNGSWIRPVSTSTGGAISNSQCQVADGHQIQQLDVVGLVIDRATPLINQPENHLISDRNWHLLRKRTASEVSDFLTDCEYDGDTLFGTTSNKVRWSQIEEQGVEESLLLIRATRPRFYWRDNQLRAVFVHARAEYDLSVTFDLNTSDNGRRSSSEWWLTVSLGGPWPEQNNDCYKLIAGAIEIPDI
ncbi:MAG: hypothetical protein KTV68_05640 [Acidimicrobiia bacterium]|nr:hypothetical protein [Acidimicrobiia bacterium]MCY4433416.1 hypothetical protein [bacterium]